MMTTQCEMIRVEVEAERFEKAVMCLSDLFDRFYAEARLSELSLFEEARKALDFLFGILAEATEGARPRFSYYSDNDA